MRPEENGSLVWVDGSWQAIILAAGIPHTSLVKAEDCGENSAEGTCAFGTWLDEFPKIQYEGPDSKNLLAFHYYNADEVILGKPMKEWYASSQPWFHRPALHYIQDISY